MTPGRLEGHAPNPEVRRRARLLSTFLLLMTGVFGLTDVVSVLTQPGPTTSACSSGSTTWPPPNTSAPAR